MNNSCCGCCFFNSMGYFALQNEMSCVVVLAECVDNVLFLLCSATGKQKVSISAAWIQAKPEVSITDPSRLSPSWF